MGWYDVTFVNVCSRFLGPGLGRSLKLFQGEEDGQIFKNLHNESYSYPRLEVKTGGGG